MKRRVETSILVLLLAPLAALAQDNPYRLKPGATGRVCFECHFDIEDLLQLPSVHSPVSGGECSECHNPHAASHGQLLAADAATICLDCHAEIVPQKARSVHKVLVETGCAACHDPHASKNANNLVTAGNRLCLDCHESLSDELGQYEFGHSPVEDDCMTCHDPHASSEEPFLLKSSMGSLCAECHRTDRASFIERHMGFPVGASDCGSCHASHGSSRPGILLTEVHAPVSRKMCNQCHADPSRPAELKRAGQELCSGCHSALVNETIARNRIHWPIAGGDACLSCHSPHASSETGLLKQPTIALCGECHADAMRKQEEATVAHAPVADGECSSCHAPHAADNVFLIEADGIMELCGECHDWRSHSSHPIGPDFTDPRNQNLTVDCSSCHASHGSSFKAMSHLDPSGPLCVQCHPRMSR